MVGVEGEKQPGLREPKPLSPQNFWSNQSYISIAYCAYTSDDLKSTLHKFQLQIDNTFWKVFVHSILIRYNTYDLYIDLFWNYISIFTFTCTEKLGVIERLTECKIKAKNGIIFLNFFFHLYFSKQFASLCYLSKL